MRAIFPGSFDPVTIGHLNLIGRSLGFLDELVVAVMYNPDKPGFFPVKQRIELLKEACRERGYARCRVLADEGLLVNLARKEGIRLVIRGVRNSADLDNETAQARANALLLPGLETIMLSADSESAGISSSLIRQIAALGGEVGHFVPPNVARAFSAMNKSNKDR